MSHAKTATVSCAAVAVVADASGQFDLVCETRDLIEPNPFPDGFRERAA